MPGRTSNMNHTQPRIMWWHACMRHNEPQNGQQRGNSRVPGPSEEGGKRGGGETAAHNRAPDVPQHHNNPCPSSLPTKHPPSRPAQHRARLRPHHALYGAIRPSACTFPDNRAADRLRLKQQVGRRPTPAGSTADVLLSSALPISKSPRQRHHATQPSPLPDPSAGPFFGLRTFFFVPAASPLSSPGLCSALG